MNHTILIRVGLARQTTLPESSASRIERQAKLKLDESTGGLEGKLTLTFTWLEAMMRRLEERHEDDTDRKKYLEDQVREYIPAAIDVDLTNKPDWNSSEPPLVAEFDLKVPGWSSAAGRRALMPGACSAPRKSDCSTMQTGYIRSTSSSRSRK